MSDDYKGALFEGNLTLKTGQDPARYGLGDLNVSNNVAVFGTTVSSDAHSGALTVAGGSGIAGAVNLGSSLNVLGYSTLNQTRINTTSGTFVVAGDQGVSMAVGGPVIVKSTSGPISISSTTGPISLETLAASNNAITLNGISALSGITVNSGTSGAVSLNAGSGGLSLKSTMGPVAMTSLYESLTINVDATSGNKNLELVHNGATGSQISIRSSGVGSGTGSSVRLCSTNTLGTIQLDNNGGVGAGSITALAGSGGLLMRTNTGGTIQLLAQGGNSSYSTFSTTDGQTATLGLYNSTDSVLNIESEGTGKALQLRTLNTAGSIGITTQTSGSGSLNLVSGSGGITGLAVGGAINFTTTGGGINLTERTNATNQDMNIALRGTSANTLAITSESTAPLTAVNITANTGGVTVQSGKGLYLQSTDPVSGVCIGTSAVVPVRIGSNNSTTTIQGELIVQGARSTVNSTILNVTDNIIQVNNGPAGSADGGIAIKRYQRANDTGVGDVVSDVAFNFANGAYNTAQGGSLTTITLATASNKTDGFYNGWWIKIISGQGANQVRRIASYVSSTNVATIYTTADNTANPTVPVEGMNFTTAPSSSSVYGLYGQYFTTAMWRSNEAEYAIAFSAETNLSSPAILAYANMRVARLAASSLVAPILNAGTAPFTTTVTLTDNSTAYVPIPNLNRNFGSYMFLIEPQTNTADRPFSTYMCVRGSGLVAGQVQQLASFGTGLLNLVSLRMQWQANAMPSLGYNNAPGITGTTVYSVRVHTC